MGSFLAQGDPDIDEVSGRKIPVPSVLMPTSIAAEARLFCHDAVVVNQRHHDVRAQQLLDIVPSLADATEMLFADPDAHEARRTMARAIDRIAGFIDVPAVVLSLEIERYRREQNPGLADEQRAKVAAEIAS